MRGQLEPVLNLATGKRTQLIEKTEALIKCQSINVKHIYELAQAMKEKMEDSWHLRAMLSYRLAAESSSRERKRKCDP